MDKKNPLYDPKYPEYKEILWGAGRAFVGAFIPTMGAMLISATPGDFSCWENAKKFLFPVMVGSFAAGIVGLGKFLRSLYPESAVLARLPI